MAGLLFGLDQPETLPELSLGHDGQRAAFNRLAGSRTEIGLVHTRFNLFSGLTTGQNSGQNNIRVATGLVLSF